MLALQLLEERKFDHEADYELNQMFSDLAIEQQAEVLDPANNDSCVCALCKSNVARRVQSTKIICELPGCLDIDVKFADFRVEDVMIKLCQIVDEHKRHSEESNMDCCSTRSISVKDWNLQVVLLDENFEFQPVTGEMHIGEKNSLALFIECDSCSFLDFMNLF